MKLNFLLIELYFFRIFFQYPNFQISKPHRSKGLPGIRVARPGPIFSSPDRDGPDFFQPDRARDLKPDPGPIGISRFSPIFKMKIFWPLKIFLHTVWKLYYMYILYISYITWIITLQNYICSNTICFQKFLWINKERKTENELIFH